MFSWKNQKLELHLLLVFLCLLAISSTIIVTFSYESDYRSLLKFSRGTIDRAGSLIVEKVDCLFDEMEITPMLSVGLVRRNPDISLNNTVLISHLLDEVKYKPDLYGFHVGAPNGNYLSSLDLSVSGAPPLAKNIPDTTRYLVAFIDAKSDPATEIWHYYDKHEKLVGTEKVLFGYFNVKNKPWYQGAVQKKGAYWTSVYKFTLTNQLGIDVSLPVYTENKELIAVIGSNLTLQSLSDFLLRQKVGKTGRAFILDSKGKAILPIGTVPHRDVVPTAYEEHLRTEKNNLIVKFQGEKYLVSIRTLPSIFGKEWQILIVVPFSDYFGTITKTHHQTLWICLGILVLSGIFTVFFSKKTSKPIEALAAEVEKIKHFDFGSDTRVDSHVREIIQLDSSIASMRTALRSFTRYVPKEIVNKLIDKGHEIELGGEKREMTLMFSDITGFTTFAESLPLETLNQLLREYFSGMTKAILEESGTIDKYIGDGLMAFWNAPDETPDHVVKGCNAALNCQAFLESFNRKQREAQMPELPTRIGLNTGEMIAGNIGTQERMNYTVIGDVVNLTQRIQEKNKEFYTRIIISEEVVKKSRDQFVIRPLDVSIVKGRKGKIQIYDLIAKKDTASPEQVAFAALFTKGYEAYHSGKRKEAKAIFEEVLQKFPGDPASSIYLQRIENT